MLRPHPCRKPSAVTASRMEQQLARRAGQRQRAQAGRHPPLAGRRGRRCAAADSDVQPVPAHEQPGVASDRAGRVAARHRSERRQPHARAARQRAVQRSVRRLGVLDARAAGRSRPHRSRRHVELEPLRQLRDGRRHQHRRRPRRCRARSTSRRNTATATAPKVDFRGSDVWGKLGVARWRSLRHRRLPDRRRRRRPSERGPGRQERGGGIPQRQRQARVHADERVNVPFFRGGILPRRARSTARTAPSTAPTRSQRHDVDQRERRRARRDAGRRRDRRRASSPTSRRSAATSSRCRRRRRRAASAA